MLAVLEGGSGLWHLRRVAVEIREVNRWCFYTATEFHIETLKHCEMPYQYPYCNRYLGDNDATSPQLTCLRPAGHRGKCDNLRP